VKRGAQRGDIAKLFGVEHQEGERPDQGELD